MTWISYRLLLEGVEPKKIDKLSKAFGFPVGAVTLMDEVGIDVGAHISEFLTKQFGDRLSGMNPEVLSALVGAGLSGTSNLRSCWQKYVHLLISANSKNSK